jgi:hypothetical protein
MWCGLSGRSRSPTDRERWFSCASEIAVIGYPIPHSRYHSRDSAPGKASRVREGRRALVNMALAGIRFYEPKDAAFRGAVFFDAVRTGGLRDYSQSQVEAWAPAMRDPARFDARARDGRLMLVLVPEWRRHCTTEWSNRLARGG